MDFATDMELSEGLQNNQNPMFAGSATRPLLRSLRGEAIPSKRMGVPMPVDTFSMVPLVSRVAKSTRPTKDLSDILGP